MSDKDAVLLVALTKKLEERDSWCGETHIQKATYFLRAMCDVPLSYEFFMYKHGPFSFEVRDELTALRADQILALKPQPFPYGPKFSPTDAFNDFAKRFPKTLSKFDKQLDFVADNLSGMGVAELERVATALFVWKETGPIKDERWASRLRKLKPHISPYQAEKAVEKVKQLIEKRESAKGS